MALSRAEIALLVEELQLQLDDAGIQRVYEDDVDTRVLQLRRPGHTLYLTICTALGYTRLHLTETKPDQPPRPSALTMQLRKWIGGGWLEAIEQVGGDRIVDLRINAVDPDWQPPEEGDERDAQARPPRVVVHLVCELVGRHPNLFLLDADRRILGQLHGQTLGERDLAPGGRYEPPPPPPDGVGQEVRWGLEAADPAQAERSAIVDAHYRAREHADRLGDLEQDLTARLDRRIKRLERRIGHIESDLARAESAEDYKRRGELLQSAWGKVERGAEAVAVPDFYAEGMPEVGVPLDPSKNLQQNIEHYFHQYRRLTEATETIEERLLESMEALDAARQARQALEDARGDLEALGELRDRLERERVIERPRQRGRAGEQAERKPYREFRARSGAPILVGRGAKDNDTVSTHVARGRDLWLHARDWAGAHVILRMDKDAAPRSEDMIDAATLAAHFSKGRRDTLVDVTYTRAKHVRKPKGAPPGLVTVADASTIGVRIEPERLKRLLDTEEQ